MPRPQTPLPPTPAENPALACRRIRINGVVQGVGFRPFVLRLAKEIGLTGWVRNDARGVEIEICGTTEHADEFITRLHKEAPPFACIDTLQSRFTGSVAISDDFFILDSRGGRAQTMIGRDTTVCRDCLNEMFTPEGRRWRYAFTSCAHCGPRYTLCRGLPFDRERTSMGAFSMCGKCRAEYQRPEDRRLHAEGNCCPKCGPQLSLLDASGKKIRGDAIANAYALLKAGKIVAIKGPGGFHLACDARQPASVAALRNSKGHPAAPFPVMFANALSAADCVQVNLGEPGLLNLPERPVILLRKRGRCDSLLSGVAPNLPRLGVVLPFSPTHYLLFHEAAERPSGSDWLDQKQEFVLVMTSGNPAQEPMATGNAEALQRLSGMADAFLVNDCDIVTRCDDSVAHAVPGGIQLIRRARGYAPRAIKMRHSGPPVLAVGGLLKNTVCITRGDEAFVSQHIGTLSTPESCAFFDETLRHLLDILEVAPALIAHDFQKDTHAFEFATKMALQRGIPLLGVQHHHAHIASVLAEHRMAEPVAGLALDAGEIGLDGAFHGSGLLAVDGARAELLGHLAPLPVAGGHAAAQTPVGLAAAVLHALGRNAEIARRFAGDRAAEEIAGRLRTEGGESNISSMRKLLDAAAGLLGVSLTAGFSEQCTLRLEGLAERFGAIEPLPGGWIIGPEGLDLLPLFAVLAEEKDPARGAALFHATLAEALADWLCHLAPTPATVVASGGCLQNQVLARALRSRLLSRGRHLVEARHLPPSDGGLSLGQAWVAQQYLLG